MSTRLPHGWNESSRPRARSVLLLTRFALEKGIDEATALAGTGVTVAALEHPDATATPATEFRVVDNIVRAAPPGQTWGLEAGLRYHLTFFGVWGLALLSAPTTREALDIGVRFVELTPALTTPYPDFDGGDVVLVFGDSPGDAEVRRFVAERDTAVVSTVQRELRGEDTRFLRVAFSHTPPPGSEAAYVAAFGLTPDFDQDRTCVTFDPEVLDIGLPQADLYMTAEAQRQCQELLAALHTRTGWAGQVRDLIGHRLRDLPSLADVAKEMHTSERTLRRKLAEEGTSVRALVDETRSVLASEYLRSTNLTAGEIAHRLGYVEVSSFSQAFRRWHGMSARAFRTANH